MKLKSYIKTLQMLEKKVGDVELIYGTDDEGNSFNPVSYSPGIKYVPKEDLKRGSIDGMDIYDNKENDEMETVVCIN